MGLKSSEQVKSVMAFPPDVYGSLKVGALGGVTEMVNGAAAPGTTGPMGDTGPAGGPIDTLGFSRALITIKEAGATVGTFTVTGKHGTNPWFSHAGTTNLPGFSETVGSAANGTYNRSIDVDLRNCQRYLWIHAIQTTASASRFSVDVVLTSPDKMPVSQNAVDAVPA